MNVYFSLNANSTLPLGIVKVFRQEILQNFFRRHGLLQLIIKGLHQKNCEEIYTETSSITQLLISSEIHIILKGSFNILKIQSKERCQK